MISDIILITNQNMDDLIRISLLLRIIISTYLFFIPFTSDRLLIEICLFNTICVVHIFGISNIAYFYNIIND